MAQNGPTREASSRPSAPSLTSAPDIPDKLYFRIGDVARICDLPAYVLRFWETEFPQLKPNKGGTGQRLYRRRDVELALKIKQLLYQEGYTIPGARQLLKADRGQNNVPQLSLLGPEPPETRKLQAVRRELQSIAAMLSRAPGASPHSKRIERRAPALQPASKEPGPAPTPGILFELPGFLE